MVKETRLYPCLFSLARGLLKEASVISVNFAYYVEDVQSIARRSDDFRVM
jgi:hypothetical protein